jgi:hypothetical protein
VKTAARLPGVGCDAQHVECRAAAASSLDSEGGWHNTVGLRTAERYQHSASEKDGAVGGKDK